MNLEKQVESVVRAYDQQLAFQIEIIAKREDVAHYQSQLSSGSLTKAMKVSVLNELKNSVAILQNFEKNNDLGLNFTNQFTVLLDTLMKLPLQDYEKSKKVILALLDQFEQKYSARQVTINELPKSSSYELYQRHNLNLQTLVQVSSDLDNKMSKDLVVQINEFQKLLKSPDLDYAACVSAINQINELSDRFQDKEDLPINMKNLLVLLDKQYEAFYYRGLAESYPELKQACADVAGPLVTVIDRLHTNPPKTIIEFLERYQKAVQALGEKYFQQVVLNQEDIQSPNRLDSLVQEAADQINNLPKALRDKVNECAQNLKGEIVQLQAQFSKPLIDDLEGRVLASLERLKQLQSQLDSLTHVATLSDDQKHLIQVAEENAKVVLSELPESIHSNQLLDIQFSEQVNIIQAKAKLLSEALSSIPQDLSAELPALQAVLTKLVKEDRINQAAQKNAETSLSNTLGAIRNAMKEFFTNTIPSLIDAIQQSKKQNKLQRKSVSHETRKEWVSEGQSRVHDASSQATVDPGESFAKKKQ